MAWFERVVFSDEKLLIWRAMAFWKAELFTFRTSHRSTKSHKIFPLSWGRFERSTQIGLDIQPLAGFLLRYVTAYFHVLGPNFGRQYLSQIRELGHV